MHISTVNEMDFSYRVSDLKMIFASYCFSSPAKLFLTFYGALNVHLQWTFNVVLLILVTKNKF